MSITERSNRAALGRIGAQRWILALQLRDLRGVKNGVMEKNRHQSYAAS